MELRRTDFDGVSQLATLWKTTPGAEMEAMLTGLDMTGWQDIIQYLRSLGMREEQQILRLNICLSNDIRFTLEGAGVIQAYCRDNKIHNKPYTAMLKENITDAVPVELESYSARAKLKRELPLAADDMRVKDALARWDQLAKLYRQIQRFEFVAPGGLGLRFDVSLVREGRGRTYQESRITLTPARYEAEVEVTATRADTTAKDAMTLLLKGLGWMLQGRQRSYVLLTNKEAGDVHDGLAGLFGGGGRAGASTNNRGGRGGRGRNAASAGGSFRYPGPQPATLERANMSAKPEPGVPNLLATPGGYNVTDKADGLRCMLYIATGGKLYLVDGGGRVYATGKIGPSSLVGTALDGEWIQRTRRGEAVSLFYAFDILSYGGDTSVVTKPFMVAGAMAGSAAEVETRYGVLKKVELALRDAEQKKKGVPLAYDIQVRIKNFRTVEEGGNLFRDAVTPVLDAATATAPYNTDGLIFTPNAAPLPLGRRSWPEQLKWKPPTENTIDFLVLVEKELDAKGAPTAVDKISTRYREDSGHTVRYKTLRLFVGSNRDGAYSDPRATVMNPDAPLPSSTEEGAWRPVEFRPTEPRDPTASVCYVAIGEGAADPAGATLAAGALDTDSTTIRTTRTGDVLQSDMIVEMAYYPERAPGWRWVPTRVRHDKTERWRAGAQSGTMNADWVSNSIWSCLHNPITEEGIRTGVVAECVAPASLVAPTLATTGARRAPARELVKVQCLKNFHEGGIKREILLKPVLTAAPGATLCDLAMGRGADIHKWVAEGVSYVFGCDVVPANLNDPEDGAYRKLLDKIVSLGGRDRVPPMLFVQADAARRLKTGEAGMTPEDQMLLSREFGSGGRGAAGYDVVSCMFALPYMFRDENTLSGFLTNLADTVKVGGYFVGCCMDGDAVARLLYGHTLVTGRDGAADAWILTKRYAASIGASVPPSAVGLGMAVELDFISQGENHTEYLVSWPYLQTMMATAGLELLTPTEFGALGLPASSQMFGDVWAASGGRWAMTDAMKRLSFLNRWFIFKRRSDARPAPPREPVAPPAMEELTQMKTEYPDGTAVPEIGGSVLTTGPGGGSMLTTGPGGGSIAGAASTILPLPSSMEEVAPASMPVLEVTEKPMVAATAAPERYLISIDNVEPDMRLGDALSDWPRYLTTGMFFELEDKYIPNPAVTYPSIDAAVSAAKYQVATTYPEIAQKQLAVNGTQFQAYLQLKAQEEAKGASKAVLDALANKFMKIIRAVGVNENILKLGKKYASNTKQTKPMEFNPDKWLTNRASAYKTYIKQRYEKDARYRAMIDAVRAKGGEILVENGKTYNELGVGVLPDGTILGGDNLIGKWMMEVTAE